MLQAGQFSSQLNNPWGLVVVSCEKLVAENEDSSGNHRKGSVRRWSRYQATTSEGKLRRPSVSYNDLWSVQNSDTIILTCNYDLFMSPINLITNPNPVYSHSITWQYTRYLISTLVMSNVVHLWCRHCPSHKFCYVRFRMLALRLCDSSVSIVTGCGLEERGFDLLQRQDLLCKLRLYWFCNP
jgi:hypothetical protein